MTSGDNFWLLQIGEGRISSGIYQRVVRDTTKHLTIYREIPPKSNYLLMLKRPCSEGETVILLKALCVYMIFTFICIQTLSVNQYPWFSCFNTDTHTHTFWSLPDMAIGKKRFLFDFAVVHIIKQYLVLIETGEVHKCINNNSLDQWESRYIYFYILS